MAARAGRKGRYRAPQEPHGRQTVSNRKDGRQRAETTSEAEAALNPAAPRYLLQGAVDLCLRGSRMRLQPVLFGLMVG